MSIQTLPNHRPITIHSLAELIPQHLWVHGGIIEVITQQHDSDELQLIIPTLARLTHGGRWLAWVGSPFRFTTKSLEALSADPYRLLQIYPGKQSSHLNVFNKALATGRCCAVMAWSKQYNDQELQQLKQAARQGNAIGVLLAQEGQRNGVEYHADLSIRLSRTPQGLAINLKAPHFIGEKVYHLADGMDTPANRSIQTQPVLPNKLTEVVQPTQLSFF